MGTEINRRPSMFRVMLPWMIFSVCTAVLIANLGAIVDSLIHPEIPYFDEEHLIVGTVSGIVSLIALGGAMFFMYRSRLSTRKKLEAEAAYHRSVRRYADLFKASSDAIIFFDHEGRLTDVNPAGVFMLGHHGREALVGKLTEKDFFSSDGDMETIHGIFDSGGTVTNREMDIFTAEGKQLHVLLSAGVERDQEDAIVSVSYIIKDMTEIYRMQRKLAEKQKMDSIGRITGGIAHDFGNLMMTIQGNAEMAIKNSARNAGGVANLEQILMAAERATRLTQDLNIFSQKKPMHMSPVDINRIISDLDGTLNMIAADDISITTGMSDEIYIVQADYISLERVIISLFMFLKDMNSRGGRIEITTGSRVIEDSAARRTPGLEEGCYAIISIRDDGPGMDPEELAGLFEPYSAGAQGVGSDLGLPMVYGIVRQHQGWLEIQSEKEKGTAFTIYLPVHEGFALDLAETSREDISELRGSGEKVLLVEDEEQVRSLVGRMLSDNGYRVFNAADANEAFAIFAREKGEIDLVFCDVSLPGENGLSLVQNLSSYRKDLPVLLTSGYQATLSEWQLIKDHGYIFLQKPFQLAEMLISIREALQREGNHTL